MNRVECDILKTLAQNPCTSQRELSEISGHSLGIINRSLKELIKDNYINDDYQLTPKAKELLKSCSPKNAIILAAGFGMRMVPINMETPKGLLEVKGETLIERLIRQLHEVGIRQIYIVVGFMKEHYEYLIDTYQVELIVNSDYTTKNNLYSLEKALPYLSGSYIIPCDIWCRQNPFSQTELYSWYMINERKSDGSPVRVNKRKELVLTEKNTAGNSMVGISYLCEAQAKIVRNRVKTLCESGTKPDAFWEDALYQDSHMIVQARMVPSSDVIEINTYEQLRDLDSNSNNLQSETISLIANILNVTPEAVTEITILKKGMTNRSFLFKCSGKRYIMRIPVEGTSQLINRMEECEVYHTIQNKNICDNCIYINAQNGYKLTEYIENSRMCNPFDEEDIKKCMTKLRSFHEMNLQVAHEFSVFDKINFYESLWKSGQSVYRDYETTRKNVFSLRNYIDSHVTHKTLTHIDAVPDNFLFAENEYRQEEVYLIDWEYAGMQDPHLDIAMFSIYAFYNQSQIDNLIQMYFDGNCKDEIRIKIYCYVAACGLLWSNWCEYKKSLGVDFGEYALRQYRYAKEYYRIVCGELGKEKDKWDIR